MKIILSPDRGLRQQCEPITPEELPQMAKLAKKMAKVMYKYDGCGLAAPQVGVLKQMIVIDTGVPKEDGEREENPIFILNPRVSKLGDETECGGEGCLSIPGITVEIERATYIELEALDLDGSEIEITAEGFDARAIQHELDHLAGITMFEHLDVIERSEKLIEYEQAKAAGAKPGETSIEQQRKRT